MLSDYERGYLMARSVHSWGFTYEEEEAFATRIAKLAEAEGIQAAAQSISDQANSTGLQMTPQRVLKSLIHVEGQVRRTEPRKIPGAPPPLPPRTGPRLDYSPPPGYRAGSEGKREARGSAMQVLLPLAAIAALIAALWYFMF